MKLYGLTTVVSLISSAESAEATHLLCSSSYGGSAQRIHPRAHPAFVAVGYYGGVGRPRSSA